MPAIGEVPLISGPKSYDALLPSPPTMSLKILRAPLTTPMQPDRVEPSPWLRQLQVHTHTLLQHGLDRVLRHWNRLPQMKTRLWKDGIRLQQALAVAPAHAESLRALAWQGCDWYLQVQTTLESDDGRVGDTSTDPFHHLRETLMPQGSKSPPPDNRQLAESLLTLVDTAEADFAPTSHSLDGVDQHSDGLDRELNRIWGESYNRYSEHFENLARQTLLSWLQGYSWTRGLEAPHIGHLWSHHFMLADTFAEQWEELTRDLGIAQRNLELQRCGLLLRAIWPDTSSLLITGEVGTHMSGRCQRLVAVLYQALTNAGHAVLPVLFGLDYRTSVEVPDLVDVHMTAEDLHDRWLPEAPDGLHARLDRLRGIPA